MNKPADLGPYTNVLPYASEIFGVYQPLLGWKSRRIADRIKTAFATDINRAFGSLHKRFKPHFEVALAADGALQQIRVLEPGRLKPAKGHLTGSFLLDTIAEKLPPLEEYQDAVWDAVAKPEHLSDALHRVVVPRTTEWYQAAAQQEQRTGRGQSPTVKDMVAAQLGRESALAGYILHLKDTKQTEKLKAIFYKADARLALLAKLLAFQDPLDYFDPFKDIERAGLSPIGVVHLFRQYFFEFDTFLGPPVSHVWMSPGATVELLEINTRKTILERSIENALETSVKTEKELTEEDEISDAVKQDNRSDVKFGMNATVNQGWIGGSATASTSIDMSTTEGKAREVSHRHMRQQTEKLATEIRKNYKSTFKTVTEVTDTSSKRYVLSNTTDKLINYELRRKMRQVGVQVQDIGTYLCWQTHVDDPGRQLGIAKLVHIAKGPDLDSIPPPESIPVPGELDAEKVITISFVQTSEDTSTLDEGYRHGREVEEEDCEGDLERIQDDFPGEMVCDQSGYRFGSISIDPGGADVDAEVRDLVEEPPGHITFRVHLNYVHFHGASPIQVKAKVKWLPLDATLEDVHAKNRAKLDEFNERTRHEYEKAFVEAARERIKLASNIEPRRFEDLREEERIVVYRSLVQDMLTKDIPMPDDRTRHVVSELLNTIFDVDKMLYFVAPEWWRPRLHRSHLELGGIREAAAGGAGSDAGGPPATVFSKVMAEAMKHLIVEPPKAAADTQIAPIDTVGWGGPLENRADNYYITEESRPAKLGASLGWLMQLDGDNMRNAFLNAPWVKAVLPIRPGRERAAMNWLQRVHVEGTDGLDATYVAPADQLQEIPHSGAAVTVRDAILHLCEVVAKKHADSQKVDRYPADEIHDDNRVSATPIDRVYEHGFYPLQGGFRAMPGSEHFEVFDQWVEVLPTDQVVPVEVTYDPKTGRQV